MQYHLNELAEYVYNIAKDVGFHTRTELPIGDMVANIHSEVSELWEAYRKNELNYACDKVEKMVELGLHPLTCASEEIADILIRTLDLAKAMDIDVDKAVQVKCEYNKTRPHRNGGKLA